MSLTFTPPTLLYAVLEHLQSSAHLYDPMDTKPEKDGQYRLVCLVINADDAWRLAHLLRALNSSSSSSDGRYQYSVYVAEPEMAEYDPLSLVESDNSNRAP